MKVLVIPPDGDARLAEVSEPEKLDEFYALIGDCQEVSLIGGFYPLNTEEPDGQTVTWRAIVDEDGKPKGLRVNRRATALAYTLDWHIPGQFLVGTILFAGGDTTEKVLWTDLPEDVLAVARRMRIVPVAG